MDIDGLEEVLRKIENGQIRCYRAAICRSHHRLAGEILNARAVLRFWIMHLWRNTRTQAVFTRRASERNGSDGLGVLDAAAIEKVQKEAWPEATNAG